MRFGAVLLSLFENEVVETCLYESFFGEVA